MTVEKIARKYKIDEDTVRRMQKDGVLTHGQFASRKQLAAMFRASQTTINRSIEEINPPVYTLDGSYLERFKIEDVFKKMSSKL